MILGFRYAASKAGALGMTKTLAVELVVFGRVPPNVSLFMGIICSACAALSSERHHAAPGVVKILVY